ncbi:MAG: cupin domain-containing protein [Candidatus Krumholzibacteriota bacterium]
MHPEAARLIDALGLEPHPEGGYYRETWRSPLTAQLAGGPGEPARARSFGTAIYYLLAGREVSRLHRLKTDEIFHLYAGGPLVIHVLTEGEGYRNIRLGRDLDAGHTFQATVPGGGWFGASLADEDSFALVGCTLAPGFDFADFEMGGRAEMLAAFPDHEDIIRLLT